ncbi:MAG: hypothetical protein OJF50_002639 [Nitrospira sp.]|jgi:hypothetical protein|nr:hypothetical protein [Nitrospira sp.]
MKDNLSRMGHLSERSVWYRRHMDDDGSVAPGDVLAACCTMPDKPCRHRTEPVLDRRMLTETGTSPSSYGFLPTLW